MLEKPIQRGGSMRKECLCIMHASKCQLLLHWGSHFLQSPARRTPLSSLWAQRGICQSNGEHWIAWQSANQPLWTTFSATVSTCVLDHASFVKIFERRSVDSTYFEIVQTILTWRKTCVFLWFFEAFPSVHENDLNDYSHQAHYTFLSDVAA